MLLVNSAEKAIFKAFVISVLRHMSERFIKANVIY